MTNLFKALSNFQNECPVIHQGTKGYGYTYSDLKSIFKVINPILKKNGLGFYQLVQGQAVETHVFHIESGETISSSTDIPHGVTLKGMNDFQVMGSGITYVKRYAISAILGLITDSDIDACGEQTNSLKHIKPNSKEWQNAINKNIPLNQVKQHYKITNKDAELYNNEINKNK